MISPILVPKLGMTQQDITVVKWLKGDGENVDKGQGVVAIETAKVNYEIEAPAAGMVFSLKKVKAKVKIGEALGVVADSAEEFEEYKDGLPQEAEDGMGLIFDEAEAEEGVRLSFEDDSEQETASAVSAADLGDRLVLERIPFVGMRRTIADNLVASLQSGAQLTVVSETDFTELAGFRRELRLDRGGDKITFGDMLVTLLVSALNES